jgi:hypothetical protein
VLGGSLCTAQGQHVRRRLVLIVGAVGVTLFSAAPAQASVIGVGDAAFGNACANQGVGAQSHGATASGSGALGGNSTQLPLNVPRDRCGNSGIVCDFSGELS